MDKIQQVNRDYYDKNAEKWAAAKTHSFYSEVEFRRFVHHTKSGATILDIGCGYGRDVPLFLGIGRKLKYEGLDISKSILNIAKSRFPQLKFYKGNLVEKKTLPKEKYGGFWSAATFQHIPEKDWSVMLENLESILNKDAIGYFSLPGDRPNPASAEDSRHFTVLTDRKVRDILDIHKWKVLETGTLPATRGTAVWRWYIVRLPKG